MYNALIRTHHITSRKKVAVLKAAAKKLDVYALLRYGGSPGMMYVEGEEDGVRKWVEIVKDLRYKDYQLVSAPAQIPTPAASRDSRGVGDEVGIEEVDAVRDFGKRMEAKGILDWWRIKAGFKAEG